ncbi:MAG: 8-amino-7-oxononanoate synthase [Actinomycetota bacterium]|nr:8-amino-7-oxononanoate synthase [Actinomycetota bacterium]
MATFSRGANPLDPLHELRRVAAQRARSGMRRTLRPRAPQDALLDLASNDYLGLARDLRVTRAAVAAVRTWGAGSTGSRLVTGSTTLHSELEESLADFTGTAGALVFSSGYLANLAVLTALAGPDTVVVSDAVNHASIVDACRLSRADVVVVPHRDVEAVEAALADSPRSRALVVSDAVFSVDGDLAPVEALHAVARRQGALLVVDEAHSLGVLGDGGRGAVAAAGLSGEPDVVLTVTLSKSLGSQGGAVLGDPVVIEHLINAARPFIFDTGLAPAAAGAAAAALAVLRDQPELPRSVRARSGQLARVAADAGWRTTSPEGAVTALLVGAPEAAVAAAEACLAAGVRVGCFRPPSVPDGISRLRLTARADLSDADVERAAAALRR